MKTALLVGASGLVGSALLELLLGSPNYSEVKVLVRKELPQASPKLKQVIVNFDELEKYSSVIHADDVFCTLGSTMKNAGSRMGFYKVDYTYVTRTAEIALENGASQFLMVSAMGAAKKSAIFYNRVKGEAEEAVKVLPFKSVTIFRPSLLMGKRKEFRFGERSGIVFARLVTPLMIGPLRKFRAIESTVVAGAMLKIAGSEPAGVRIIESEEIKQVYNNL
jgi:uncharacterized protein YbjT (DUF2867 family)